jgi:hypothetical protein
MDAASLTRMRWRLRGAWLWPSFVVLSLADATIVHNLPLSGDSESWVSGWVMGTVFSLIAIVLAGNLLGRVVRRLRPDMPRVVARNYAGALITLGVTLALLAGGLVHRQVISSDSAAVLDATARAEAYIGAHAPAAFQHDLRRLDTAPVDSPTIYRTCAIDVSHTRYYCVVVNRRQPFGQSVHYSGSTSNQVLAEGTG